MDGYIAEKRLELQQSSAVPIPPERTPFGVGDSTGPLRAAEVADIREAVKPTSDEWKAFTDPVTENGPALPTDISSNAHCCGWYGCGVCEQDVTDEFVAKWKLFINTLESLAFAPTRLPEHELEDGMFLPYQEVFRITPHGGDRAEPFLVLLSTALKLPIVQMSHLMYPADAGPGQEARLRLGVGSLDIMTKIIFANKLMPLGDELRVDRIRYEWRELAMIYILSITDVTAALRCSRRVVNKDEVADFVKSFGTVKEPRKRTHAKDAVPKRRIRKKPRSLRRKTLAAAAIKVTAAKARAIPAATTSRMMDRDPFLDRDSALTCHQWCIQSSQKSRIRTSYPTILNGVANVQKRCPHCGILKRSTFTR